MSVYVDEMAMAARPAGYHGRPAKWNHLMADTSEELAAFGRQLGLRSSWLQHAGKVLEHYDVTMTVRAKALQLGAHPITYGREGGYYSMLKRAVRDRDEAGAVKAWRALEEIDSVICRTTELTLPVSIPDKPGEPRQWTLAELSLSAEERAAVESLADKETPA